MAALGHQSMSPKNGVWIPLHLLFFLCASSLYTFSRVFISEINNWSGELIILSRTKMRLVVERHLLLDLSTANNFLLPITRPFLPSSPLPLRLPHLLRRLSIQHLRHPKHENLSLVLKQRLPVLINLLQQQGNLQNITIPCMICDGS